MGFNLQPNSAFAAPPAGIRVPFSGSLNSATFTPANGGLRHSSAGVYYNPDDRFIEEADGWIAWDPMRLAVPFQPKSLGRQPWLAVSPKSSTCTLLW